ncbi:hypothetical protein [Dietzia aurantiaca]|uniref:Uncharacterized protein n=1 Tax=Dietzia aurantiaca TaxID=983873 RepID=A0ABV9PVP2_9ACTN
MTGPRDPRKGGDSRDGDESRNGDGPADPPTEQFPPAANEGGDPPTQQFPPADPPTSALPRVESGPGSAAWSQYGDESGGPAPTAGYAADGPAHTGELPPGDVPPTGPGSGGGGRDDDGRNPTPWMIVAALLAVVLVAGTVVWLASRSNSDDQIATPTTTPTRSTVTSTTRSSPTMTTPTTTGPPTAAQRCTAGFVADELGEGTRVRECDPQFLLVTRDGGESELYTWREDHWEFLAAPASDVCREQLEQLGVPDQFRRVFQPCGVTTSRTTSSSTTSPTTSATTRTTTSGTSGATTSGSSTTTTSRSQNGAAADPDEGEREDSGDEAVANRGVDGNAGV